MRTDQGYILIAENKHFDEIIKPVKLIMIYISCCHDPYLPSPGRSWEDVRTAKKWQKQRVHDLTVFLNENGANCIAGLFRCKKDLSSFTWRNWMHQMIVKSDYVLMVCSPQYTWDFLQCQSSAISLGPESTDPSQAAELNDAEFIYGEWRVGKKAKFIPVYFGRGHEEWIPRTLKQTESYCIPDDASGRYGDLQALLTRLIPNLKKSDTILLNTSMET